MRVLNALMAAAIGIVPTAATACGNPMLWMMIYAAVPGSKAVHEAELAAREDGIVQARSYVEEPGIPYHVWSMRSIEHLFDPVLPAVSRSLAPGETFTLLLVDEVAAVRFTGGTEGAEFLSPSAIPKADQIDVITTVNAVYSGWKHGLQLSDMRDRGLLTVTSAGTDATLALLFE